MKFSSVKAYPAGDNNKIEWTNETEEGVLNYVVERSTDGESFLGIGLISPGNIGSKAEYTYTYASFNNKTTWYRINSLGLTGKIIYSPVVKVRREASGELAISLYPNPVTGKQLQLL